MSFTSLRFPGRAMILAAAVTASLAVPRLALAQQEATSSEGGVSNEESHEYRFNLDLFGGYPLEETERLYYRLRFHGRVCS